MSNNIHIEDDTDHKNINKKTEDDLNVNNIKISSKKKKGLLEYIQLHKCNYGDNNFTHTWWDNNKNFTFRIEDNDYKEFIKLYTIESKKKYGELHIIEKPRDIGPLILDFDFKQMISTSEINVKMLKKIIKVINKVIKKYYKTEDIDDEILESYILMKKEPFYDESREHYSDGFHIHYPNLIIDVIDKFLIYDESKKEITSLNIFENMYKILKETDIEQANKMIFDKDVIKKNSWFMYGSGKKIGEKINLYELKRIFNNNSEELENNLTNDEIIELLSIRWDKIKEIEYKNSIEINKKLDEIRENYMTKSGDRMNIKKLFIKNGDANYDNNEDDYNGDNDIANQIKYMNNKVNKFITTDLNKTNDNNIKMAKKLVPLLNKKRAGPYGDWILVGWALFNTSPLLLSDFIQFSKQDNKKYRDGCCEKVWDECTKFNGVGGYTIASLYRWAKEDNPKGYTELMREQINILLEEGDIKTDFDVAGIIRELYKYDYVCTSISKNIWWQFNNHKWNRIDDAYTLSLKISTEVTKQFANLSAQYMLESTRENGHKSDALIRKTKDIVKLIQDLKSRPAKERIISQCAIMFYDKTFEEKLDQNNYLFGFENGIYDLKNNIFRNGSPDDYVSKSVNYKYNNKFKETDQVITDIENFFKSIQPEDDMRLYILCYCASLLEGGNKDQKFMIWTGSGSNSKGTLIELLDNTLGGYYGTLPVTLLTQKRKGSSSATPELADKFGTRLLTLQEPEEDDKIQIGFMKELTGQDKIMARPLYGDPFYYIPQFKILLACNKLPNIPSDDGGTWRRIRVIDFSQKFVDEPKLPNEKKKDPELREKLKTWNQGLIWLLINKYYLIYKEKKLDSIEPLRVKLSTDKYKQDSNIYMEYMNDMLQVDKQEHIPKDLAWTIFKEWYANSYNGVKPPPQKKLIEFFESNNYRVTRGSNGNIYGVKLKDIQIETHIDA